MLKLGMLEIQADDLRPGVVVIRLSGKLMMGPESASLESMVNARLDGGARHIVFHLADLKQIDSTGIGRFISTFNRLMQCKGSLGMAEASAVVRQSFRVTRLDTVFKFYDTEAEAVAAIPA
jgi:anti-anti-sigma factor